MEASPGDIDTKELYNNILKLDTVEEVHDFHCWSLAGGKYVLTCHVRSSWGEKAIDDITQMTEQQASNKTTEKSSKEPQICEKNNS